MTNTPPTRFLVVDDEPAIRQMCVQVGASLGFRCSEAGTAREALHEIEKNPPDLMLVDRGLPDMSGDDLLRQIRTALPRTEVTIITGQGSIESAVEAMRLGAYDYLIKPFGANQLKLLLQRMREKNSLVLENEYLRQVVDGDQQLKMIEGASAKIQDVVRMVSRLKDTNTPVLIMGESGTGKELVARAIHFRGTVKKRPFVAVDCGALVPTLIESELFGYQKGAFTGATQSKQGLFQAAAGGTIFLDEIGELPLELQTKLLRVLQEKEVRPLGTNQPVQVDVRVIAASNRDLEAAYRTGAFRKDLYFRLNVVTVYLPPLRERKGDIPALIRSFISRYAPTAEVQVTPKAMDCLFRYDWPGNVRELENAIEHAIALGNRKTIDVQDLPPAIISTSLTASFPVISTPSGVPATDLNELERATIERVFEEVKGDKMLARKLLGISRATLYRKLKRYRIGPRSGLPPNGMHA
jgi:DNA-binding NtrC family response regulator